VARKGAKAPVKRAAYSAALTARICGELAKGESVSDICRQAWACSESTFYEWLNKHPEFLAAYEVAKAAGLERMANGITAIADDCPNTPEGINKARLRIDARKWVLAKLVPKKYGDKVELDHQGSLTVEVVRFGDGKAAG